MKKNNTYTFLFLCLLCIPFKLFSQNFSSEEDYREVSATVSYNKPIGKLSFVYKPAVGFQVGYNWVHNDYSDNMMTKKGLNVGFLQYTPKADTLYYLISPSSYGTAVYTKYSIYSVSAHLEHIKTMDKVGFIAGFDSGLGFTTYTAATKDANIDIEETFSQGKFIFSPLLGLNYEFNENISASFITQYTALISFGGADIGRYDYNPIIGIYKSYASLALKVAYQF
jgi:hypothetical protein